MIEFTHETTRYKVKPENAQKIRALLAKPKKYTCEAHKAVKRGFPVFVAGMSTADYVRQFNGQFDGAQHKVTHDCPNFYKPAPMLDATQPEVWEEVDADYTEPVKVKKPKTRAAKIEALLREVLSMIDDGEPPSPSGDWAAETRKLLGVAS